MIKLKLIKTKSTSGYMLSNIKEYLGEKSFDKFKKWMFGETVGIYKGESLIYRYDFDRFTKGLKPFDSL